METKEKTDKFDVFISYRRDGGAMRARLLYEALKQRRYSVFFDFESMTAGRFGDEIIEAIHDATDVLVIVSKGCLERCKNPGDWMYREIKEALDADKNVIPVMSNDFIMPSDEEMKTYPKEIGELFARHGGKIDIEKFEAFMGQITGYMKSEPRAFTKTEIQPIVKALFDGGINMLTASEKNEFVTQIFKSRYGEELAGIVASFVDTTTGQYKNIRKRFRYEIDIDEVFRFNTVDIDEEKYFCLSERLNYEKHFLGEAVEGDFMISFVRDLDKLDKDLKTENTLFSENLLMNNSDLLKLMELSDAEKIEFYNKDMRVKLNINGKQYRPESVVINEAGIFAFYKAQDMYEGREKNVLHFKVVFSIPHRKAASFFFVSINDPTFSPEIRFTYPEDIVDVEMIPFLNRATTAEETQVFEGERELLFKDEWVLPMSGAVFIVTLDEERIE